MTLRRIISIGAAAGVADLSLAAAPAASADDAGDCNYRYVCFYSGSGLTGTLKLEKEGNWSGNVSGIRSFFNNGASEPSGADHVIVTYQYYDNSGSGPELTGKKRKCLHYGKADAGSMPGGWRNWGSVVTKIEWVNRWHSLCGG
ncbi:hypothetical protein [Nonomuraea sp. SBT364]|uniref:hypothetical protein n=1 Tax=Nonomuraea sp. SBT364 TaxID=1580530 RepID=UPI00066E3D2B|nr:hypothetical protein [Nonomuraea sp. SBT364]